MSISYTREYEQLIIFDLQNDKENLEIVDRILEELHHDLTRIRDFIINKKDRIDNLHGLIDNLLTVQNYKILLYDYSLTHELHSLMRHIEENNVSLDDIITEEENILLF